MFERNEDGFGYQWAMDSPSGWYRCLRDADLENGPALLVHNVSRLAKTVTRELGRDRRRPGSSDANVVLKNYLSEDERRQYRREYMRERLVDAFEVDQ